MKPIASEQAAPNPRGEPALLAAAQRGDHDAFSELVERHRGALHAHCYRMLGSRHDADDALQETFLRVWRGIGRFEGRSSPGSWLYRVATNSCLDAIARRGRRVLPVEHGPAAAPDAQGPPLPESVWIEPYPDELLGVEDGHAAPEARYEQRESIELAFIAALQHLPGRQRAVLILREVLGFSAKEVAETLDTSEASVTSALQRARRKMDERLPERSQQETIRGLGNDEIGKLVEGFIEAFERGDVDRIVAMLTDDAIFSMPPYAEWCQGREALGRSWLMPSGPAPRLRYATTRANGQLAFAAYLWDPDRAAYLPLALDVVALRGDRIAEVVAYRSGEVFPAFGLPEALDAE